MQGLPLGVIEDIVLGTVEEPALGRDSDRATSMVGVQLKVMDESKKVWQLITVAGGGPSRGRHPSRTPHARPSRGSFSFLT